MMERILGRVAKMIVTEKVRTVVYRLIEQTQKAQTRDIITTLADNGYADAAEFIRANYPTR